MTKEHKCVTMEYEESTGFLYLTNGEHRRVVCRYRDGKLYLWWKVDKVEVPVTIEDFIAMFN